MKDKPSCPVAPQPSHRYCSCTPGFLAQLAMPEHTERLMSHEVVFGTASAGMHRQAYIFHSGKKKNFIGNSLGVCRVGGSIFRPISGAIHFK